MLCYICLYAFCLDLVQKTRSIKYQSLKVAASDEENCPF